MLVGRSVVVSSDVVLGCLFVKICTKEGLGRVGR